MVELEEELLVLEVGVWSVCKAVEVAVLGSVRTVEVAKAVDLVECMSEPLSCLLDPGVETDLLLLEEGLEVDRKR